MAGESSIPASSEAKWRIFIVLLVAATLSPLLFFPISTQFRSDAIGLAAAASILNFVGGGVHVGATGFFYADAEVRDFFQKHRWRYYLFPLLLIVGTGMALSLADVMMTAIIVFAYFAWQTYHYQKQNYGILSFVTAATDRVRPTRLELFILQLSVWIGIVGLVKPYNLARHTPIERFTGVIHQGAAYAFWIVPVLLLAALATSPVLRRNPYRLACLTTGGLFYVPTFLFSSPVAAISGYAVAHGLQYLIFMYFVGAAKPSRTFRIALLAVIALAAGSVLAITSGLTPLGKPPQFVFGCYLGLVMSHFVIDAGIWRLRDAFPRAYMGRAFGFVFVRGQRLAKSAAVFSPSLAPEAVTRGVVTT